MARLTSTKPSRFLVGTLLAPLLWTATTRGQESQKPARGVGEVTGNDVYVRSGPSLNHYPVCKLNAGDRVTVVGQRADWYEIVPPAGTFSFISGDYVDTADHKTGVVNGDQVRVRAGSTLAEFSKLKYVVQTKLSKGAKVVILGRDPDGFLRIKPPKEATHWIHRRFVQMVPQVPGPSEEPLGARPKPAGGPSRLSPSPTGETRRTHASAMGGGPETEQRKKLEELDDQARAEMEKPVVERRFAPLLEGYRLIADQDEDEFAKAYAKARVGQLARMSALVETVRKVHKLSDEADAQRRAFLEERARIRERLPPIPTGIEVQGELRASALYPPGSRPRRFRLVDPLKPSEPTIGYVEIPEDSDIDAGVFLGRYVGVRASAVRLLKGSVDGIPIYVAGELVLMKPTREPELLPEGQ